MPVIAVNIAASVFADIQALVERGLYKSPEQFLEIAAFNQMALERGAKPEEVLAQQRHSQRPSSRPGDQPEPARAKRTVEERPAPIRRKAKVRGVSREAVDALISKLALDNVHAPPAPVPAAVRPADERLWGQVNRLLPMKFACRWIASITNGKTRWPKLDSISDAIGEDAATLGSFLEQADARAGRKRDDLLSTGLPRQGNLSSRDRFLSQFVARTTRAAEIYPGGVCQYALAQFDGDRLALTDRGIELARLENPLLDGDPGAADGTLSERERSFLVEHVNMFVPGERRDFLIVASAIREGHATPDALLAQVRQRFPDTWSDLMARTHLSGLVARMSEMALLRRRWEGRNVSYELLDGLKRLSEGGAAS